MMIMLAGRSDDYLQLITVLIVFVVVLGATALTTKWIAGYQKEMGHGRNIELLDVARLGNNKYVQIVRIGKKYLALCVCKDTVTLLCEVTEDEIFSKDGNYGGKSIQKKSFQEILRALRQGGTREESEPEEFGLKEFKPEESETAESKAVPEESKDQNA